MSGFEDLKHSHCGSAIEVYECDRTSVVPVSGVGSTTASTVVLHGRKWNGWVEPGVVVVSRDLELMVTSTSLVGPFSEVPSVTPLYSSLRASKNPFYEKKFYIQFLRLFSK